MFPSAFVTLFASMQRPHRTRLAPHFYTPRTRNKNRAYLSHLFCALTVRASFGRVLIDAVDCSEDIGQFFVGLAAFVLQEDQTLFCFFEAVF